MASRHIVQEALHDLATTFNRPPSWVDRALDLYTEQLKAIPDGALLDTVSSIVSTQTSMPSIAELRTACQSRGNATGGSPEKPAGCLDCDFTGARQMAWHQTTRWGLKVNSYAGACSCPKGTTLAASLGTWQAIRDAWLHSPDTVDVIVSDRTHSLSLEETHGPDNWTVKAMSHAPGGSLSETRSSTFGKIIDKMRRGARLDDRKRKGAGDDP